MAEPRHLSLLRASGLDSAIQSAWLIQKTKAIAATYSRLRTGGRWALTANVFAATSLLATTLLATAALLEGMINRLEAATIIATIAWIAHALRGAIAVAPELGMARSGWRTLAARTERATRATQPSVHGVIRIESATVAQPARQHAILSGITITCQPGESVVISGAAGAGKSALAALIAGAIAPTEGRYQNGSLRIGYVPEIPVVVEGTVAQNIARFTRYDFHAVTAAIDRAGVEGVLDERRIGLEMPLHCGLLHPFGTLSLREARAINLARAVFAPVDILVIDKPELAMDPDDVQAITSALRHLRASGVGLIIATNDNRFHSLADRLLHIDSGRIVQSAHAQASSQHHMTRVARGPRFAIAR